ncbi:MAG: DmsC/YnfH family molybdoenzyme membrane anchor subunit, partial [Planctomycetota bacterium]
EVIAFGLFGAVGAAPVALTSGWFDSLSGPGAILASIIVTGLVGFAGIVSSVGIYRIPARPAWDSPRTTAQFFATAALLGSLSALGLSLVRPVVSEPVTWSLAVVAVLSAVVSAGAPWSLVFRSVDSDEAAIRGAAWLMTRRFGRLLTLRTTALCIVAVLAPVVVSFESTQLRIIGGVTALVLALFAEIVGRYLFFVTVVPRNMPGSFFSKPQGGH